MTKTELKDFLQSLEHKDDALLRWERGRPPPEPPRRERQLDTAPSQIPGSEAMIALIAPYLDRERRTICEALGDALGEGLDELRDEARRLRAEIAETKAAVAEAKVALAETGMELAEVRRILSEERGISLDVPSPLQTRGIN